LSDNKQPLQHLPKILKRNGTNTSANKQFDAIDNIIFKEGLRIKVVDIHPELDYCMLVFCVNSPGWLTKRFFQLKPAFRAGFLVTNLYLHFNHYLKPP
jgi:hypothetical protein